MFSEQIRRLRLRLGISQSELARRAGYSHEFISQVERNIKTPSIKALQKIALGLGVSPSALMEPRHQPVESEDKIRSDIQRLLENLPSDKLKVIRDLIYVFPELQDCEMVPDKFKVIK
ncbi:MAG: helix-turn-helix domain-containing protein [Bacillota bacterium]